MQVMFDGVAASSQRSRVACATHHDNAGPVDRCTQTTQPSDHDQELVRPCGGRCLRCGLPIRSATLPTSRTSAPAFTDRPPPPTTGCRSFDSTSGARRDSKDNKKRGGVTFGDDEDVIDVRLAAAAAAKKRVRFASPTDDVTDDVSRQLVPVTPPPPPPLPGSSFIKMQTARPINRSQLASYGGGGSARLTTFRGPPRDASIV